MMTSGFGPQKSLPRSGKGHRARHRMQQTIDWILIATLAWIAFLAALALILHHSSGDPLAW
jgi:hypothetical protein